MKRVDSNPVSSTGHQWPCIGFYQTSTEKDRTERCTCGVKDRVMVGQAERRKRWPMRLVYVTSADDEQVRSPQPLLFIGSGTGKTQTETNTQAGGTNE